MSRDAKFVVRLTDEERIELQALVDEGRGSKSVRQRARLLLKTDESEAGPGWTDRRAAEFAELSVRTAERVRRRFVEQGLEASVYRKPSTDRLSRKLDGAEEARLIAEACSQAPEGRSRWTLKLLGDRLVALEVVESISPETVRRTLKKTTSNPTFKTNGSFPPRRMPISSRRWKTFGKSISVRTLRSAPKFAWMKRVSR